MSREKEPDFNTGFLERYLRRFLLPGTRGSRQDHHGLTGGRDSHNVMKEGVQNISQVFVGNSGLWKISLKFLEEPYLLSLQGRLMILEYLLNQGLHRVCFSYRGADLNIIHQPPYERIGLLHIRIDRLEKKVRESFVL